ncbi:MAG: hypothetical protein IKX40_11870 [Thermoguttaceae bacterium]|nr:hypothetical protein [Thermoguttaceae bacterium]
MADSSKIKGNEKAIDVIRQLYFYYFTNSLRKIKGGGARKNRIPLNIEKNAPRTKVPGVV